MRYVFVLLIAALLLFGCPGEEQAPAEEAPPAVEAPEAEAPEAEAPPEEEGPQGIELDSWSLEALATMGAPIHCTWSETTPEYTSSYDIWVNGDDYMAEGSTTTAGQTTPATVVMKDKKMYMQLPEPGMTITGEEDCDWLLIDYERLGEAMPEEEGEVETGAPEFEDKEGVTYSCFADVFGDEKFSTPGKVCDMTDFMLQAMIPPTYGPEICQGLTGQDYVDCIEMVSNQ